MDLVNVNKHMAQSMQQFQLNTTIMNLRLFFFCTFYFAFQFIYCQNSNVQTVPQIGINEIQVTDFGSDNIFIEFLILKTEEIYVDANSKINIIFDDANLGDNYKEGFITINPECISSLNQGDFFYIHGKEFDTSTITHLPHFSLEDPCISYYASGPNPDGTYTQDESPQENQFLFSDFIKFSEEANEFQLRIGGNYASEVLQNGSKNYSLSKNNAYTYDHLDKSPGKPNNPNNATFISNIGASSSLSIDCSLESPNVAIIEIDPGSLPNGIQSANSDESNSTGPYIVSPEGYDIYIEDNLVTLYNLPCGNHPITVTDSQGRSASCTIVVEPESEQTFELCLNETINIADYICDSFESCCISVKVNENRPETYSTNEELGAFQLTNDLVVNVKISDCKGGILSETNLNFIVSPDTDSDGVCDVMDCDPNDPEVTVDADSDGYCDPKDTDKDCIPDITENDENGDPIYTDVDTLPDFNDPDDDNDEIPTKEELGLGGTFIDTDLDGIYDHHDPNNCDITIFPAEPILCDNQPLTVSINQDYDSVTWYPSTGGSASGNQLEVFAPGNYSVEIVNGMCTSELTFYVSTIEEAQESDDDYNKKVEDFFTSQGFLNYNHLNVFVSDKTYGNINSEYNIELEITDEIALSQYKYENGQSVYDDRFPLTDEISLFVKDAPSEISSDINVVYLSYTNDESGVDDIMCDVVGLNTSPSNVFYKEDIYVVELQDGSHQIYYKVQVVDNNITLLNDGSVDIRSSVAGPYSKYFLKWFFKRVSTNPTTVVISIAAEYTIEGVVWWWFDDSPESSEFFSALYNRAYDRGWEGLAVSIGQNIINSPAGDFIGTYINYYITTDSEHWDHVQALTSAGLNVIFQAFLGGAIKTWPFIKTLGRDLAEVGPSLAVAIIKNPRMAVAWNSVRAAAAKANPDLPNPGRILRTDIPSLTSLAKFDDVLINKIGQQRFDDFLEKLIRANPKCNTCGNLGDGLVGSLDKVLDDLHKVVTNRAIGADGKFIVGFEDFMKEAGEQATKAKAAALTLRKMSDDASWNQLTENGKFTLKRFEGNIPDIETNHKLDLYFEAANFDGSIVKKSIEMKNWKTARSITGSTFSQFKGYIASGNKFEYYFSDGLQNNMTNMFQNLFKNSNKASQLFEANPSFFINLGISDPDILVELAESNQLVNYINWIK